MLDKGGQPRRLQDIRFWAPFWLLAPLERLMIRRNARLRREYLYRKSLEGAERIAYERKRAIRQALEGAPLPAAVPLALLILHT